MTLAPLKVGITRGPTVESTHDVHAVMLDGAGKTLAAYGDAGLVVLPRSTLKPLQVVPLVESGGAEALGISEEEIALACASHNGEELHTGRVAKWLARLGLDENALECGAHPPYDDPCSPASCLCNNCSGKHAGMLSLAVHRKAAPGGYVKAGHPVQKEILAAVADMCGAALPPESCGIDGCSVPTPPMPLENLALGIARFMNPAKLPAERAAACRRIAKAMTAYPALVAGTKNRLDTDLMAAAKGDIISKVGAEGVYVVAVPGKDTAFAVKARDGAIRASQAAVHFLLEHHNLATAEVLEAIRPLTLPVQKNHRKIVTGDVRVRKV